MLGVEWDRPSGFLWQVENPWKPTINGSLSMGKSITLWLFNIAMGNGPFIDGLPIKNDDFPWLCLNNQMVEKRDIGKIFDGHVWQPEGEFLHKNPQLWEIYGIFWAHHWGDPVTSLRKSYGIRYSYQFQHTYEPIQIKTLKCHTRYITVRIENCPGIFAMFSWVWRALVSGQHGFAFRGTPCARHRRIRECPQCGDPGQRSAPLFRRASRSGAKENFCDRTAADDGKKTESLATWHGITEYNWSLMIADLSVH